MSTWRRLWAYRYYYLGTSLVVFASSLALVGALWIGQSVKNSLKNQALQSTANVNQFLWGPRPLSAESSAAVPSGKLLYTPGWARSDHGMEDIEIWGIDLDFQATFEPALSFKSSALPEVYLNQIAMTALGCTAGDFIELNLELISSANRDHLMAHKDLENQVRTITCTVKGLANGKSSQFSPFQLGRSKANAFFDLTQLQELCDLPGRINGIYSFEAQNLTQTLQQVWRMEDLGIRKFEAYGGTVLETESMVFQPHIADKLLHRIQDSRAISTYLANEIVIDQAQAHYAVMVALPDGPESNSLSAASGQTQVSESGILLNTWLAEELGAEVGNEIEISMFFSESDPPFQVHKQKLKLEGIVDLQAAGADANLSPQVPGMSDADSMRDWDPPIPIDLGLISDRDEEYWDLHRGAPKIFVHAEFAEKWFASVHGQYTSIRFPGEAAIEKLIGPEMLGWTNFDLPAIAELASLGSTDFTQLFLAFSFFVVIAALVLMGLFQFMALAPRLKEMLLLQGIGWQQSSIRNRFLQESFCVVLVFGLLGTLAALPYSRWMLSFFQSQWSEMVQPIQLAFEIQWIQWVSAYVLAVIFNGLVVIWSLRRQFKKVEIQLLRESAGVHVNPKKWPLWLGLLGFVGGFLALFQGSSGAFFGAGFMFLVATTFIAWGLFARVRKSRRFGALARQPGRNAALVGTFSLACFMLLSVGAYQPAIHAPESFPLLARSRTGIPDSVWQEMDSNGSVRAFSMSGGQDASCLNLFKPGQPILLGVANREGLSDAFPVKQQINGETSGWELLDLELENSEIPVLADANSAMWILKWKLGQSIPIQASSGETVTIKLVGMLQHSPFQSEVLMAEHHLKRLFPDVSGSRFFMMGPDVDIEGWESSFSDYGLDIQSVEQVLAQFKEVERIYISFFKLLGTFGLGLGVFGLLAGSFRRVLDRRKELALMRVLGFEKKWIQTSLFWESLVLVSLGLGSGAFAGLVSAWPVVQESLSAVSGQLLSMIVILLVGLLSSWFGVLWALKRPLLEELKN